MRQKEKFKLQNNFFINKDKALKKKTFFKKKII